VVWPVWLAGRAPDGGNTRWSLGEAAHVARSRFAPGRSRR